MIIHLDELSGRIQTFTFEKRIKELPVLEEISAAGSCIFADPLDIRLGAKLLGEMVAVEGRAAATVQMTCNRCLIKFDGAVLGVQGIEMPVVGIGIWGYGAGCIGAEKKWSRQIQRPNLTGNDPNPGL